MSGSRTGGITLRLVGFITLVVMLALGLNAYLTHRSFEQALVPQMAKKVVTVGAGLRALVLRAVDNGIGFDQLHGVEQRFAELRAESPEIAYIALTDTQGALRHESAASPTALKQHFASAEVLALLRSPESVSPVRRLAGQYLVSMPIASAAGPLGMLHIGMNVGIVDELVLDMSYDVLVVLVVSLFATLELLHFVGGGARSAATAPAPSPSPASPSTVAPGGGTGALAQVRAPLFMFMLAEELTRSFLPGYVASLLVPMPGLSPQVVIGLPIALFMLIVALGQPVLGVHVERVGQRRAMLGGAAIAALGFVASALASSVLDLLLWRSLCALGYAMVFVAGQAYVLDHAPPGQRARSFGVFIGAIMAAAVCGPSIGGILADNIGMRPTLALAAALAAASLLVIRQLPGGVRVDPTRPAARLPRWREIVALLGNGRFMVVTGLAAVPAKLLLTGMCFYLVPMYVLSLGSTQAMAGRLLMCYAVVMVVLGPLMARLASGRERMQWLVGGGLMTSGLGGMAILAGTGIGWVFLAVLLVGVGQAMSMAAQSALLAERCADAVEQLGEGVVYGIYRLLERLGNALGPLVAALLVLRFDYRSAFVLIGAGVLLCGAAFVLTSRPGRAAALPLPSPPAASGELP